ncbi:hypothetical protein B0H12DRAFT_1140134 [Mycena haematopus]|nr:hypothetical protein B0H12DRAFT_1140134 [Mycena haematopus]
MSVHHFYFKTRYNLLPRPFMRHSHEHADARPATFRTHFTVSCLPSAVGENLIARHNGTSSG